MLSPPPVSHADSQERRGGGKALAGLALSVLALSIAFWAQTLQSQPTERNLSMGLYALAALLLVWSLYRYGGDTVLRSEWPPAEPMRLQTNRVGWLGLVAGAMLVIASLWLLQGNPRSPPAVALWMAALIVCGAAWYVRGPRPRPSLARTEILALVALLAVAFALRVYRLDDLPFIFHGDEGEMGMEAVAVLRGEPRSPFATGFLRHPSLFFFLQAASMQIAGVSVTGLRLLSAVVGTLSVLPLYLLVRLMWGRSPALLAAALLVFAHAHIQLSRLALNNIETAFLATLVLCMLVWGLRDGHPGAFTLAGLALGLSLYFYYGSRLLPIIVLVVLAREIVSRPQAWRLWGGGLALIVSGTLVAAGPLILWFWRYPFQLWERHREVSIFRETAFTTGSVDVGAAVQVILSQFQRTIGVFYNTPDTSSFYQFEAHALDPASSALLTLGMAVAVARFWQRPYYIVLVWFWGTLVAGGVLTGNAPSLPRVVGMVPVLAVFPAIVLYHLYRQAWQALGRRAVPVLGLAAGLLVIVVAYLNVQMYFVRFPTANAVYNGTIVARYIAELGPGFKTYLAGAHGQYVAHGATRFIALGMETRDVFDLTALVPARDAGKSIAYIFPPDRTAGLDIVRERYPAGHLRKVFDVRDRLVWVTYEVDRAEIERGQGVVAQYWPAGASTPHEETVSWVGLAADDHERLAGGQPLGVEWAGLLWAPQTGSYRLGLTATSPSEIVVGGQPVHMERETGGGWEGSATLVKGWHSLLVRCVQQKPEDASLYWVPPNGRREQVPSWALAPTGDVTGLLGTFYGNGQVIHQEITPAIYYFLPPLESVIGRRQDFQAEWKGELAVPKSGTYLLGLRSGGEAALVLDGVEVLRHSGSRDPARKEVRLDLAAGRHSLRLDYAYRAEWWPGLEMFWLPPGEEIESLVPTGALYPPGATIQAVGD